MGIFSFGKKDEAPARRGANRSTRSTRAERSERTERVERRTRRTERPAEADAMLLDPTLPEKQRARRRLVGAIALVVAAIVILPMVLDSHPKPVTDDIAIDIPNRPAPRSPRASTSDEDVQAGVAPDNPAAPEGAVASAPAAPAAAASKTAQAAAASSPSAKPGATRNQSALANTTPSAPAPAQSKPSAKDKAPAAQTQSATAANADSGNPSAPPGARFAVQLGAFKDDVNARSWVTKLKAAGVPAYTERRKQADGSMLTLVRAGPFADRAAASAAIAKVRDAGLTSGANNGSAQ